MNEDDDRNVTMTVIAAAGGLAERIRKATQLGHGRLTLIIRPDDGSDALRLDIIDVDHRAKPEYRNWRVQ